MHAFKIGIGTAAFLALSVLPGISQSGAGADLQSVVTACQTSDEACVPAVRSYLNSLSGLPADSYNERLVELVVALVEDIEERGCDGSELITASALNQTATFATSEMQRTQVEEIAVTVARCVPGIATAALGLSTTTDSASPG